MTLTTAGGVKLAAIETGAGPRGIVLVPELGPSNGCGWWQYATYLADRGYRVLTFDHACRGDSGCPANREPDVMADITAAANRLHADGAAKVVLMGASRGAAEVVIAGTRAPAWVVGVVSLSAALLDDTLGIAPFPATANAAASRLRLPCLFAVGDLDPTSPVPPIRALFAKVPAADKQLLVLSGRGAHGIQLVDTGVDGVRRSPEPEVQAFLKKRLGS